MERRRKDIDDLPKTVGKNIRRMRDARGETIGSLALDIDSTEAEVTTWEKGEALPAYRDFHGIAEHFDTTISELMERPDEKGTDALSALKDPIVARLVETELEEHCCREMELMAQAGKAEMEGAEPWKVQGLVDKALQHSVKRVRLEAVADALGALVKS